MGQKGWSPDRWLAESEADDEAGLYGGEPADSHRGRQLPLGCMAIAVRNSADAAIAAQARTVSSRSHRITIARQFVGGALGSQASVAWLMGTVPPSVTKTQVS